MTPRYSVTFHLLPRALRDGTHSVALTVTWARRRYRRTLNVSCPPDCWDNTVQLARPRGTFHDVARINSAVLDARQLVDDLFVRSQLDGRLPSEGDLAALFSDGPAPETRRTVSATLSEFVAEQTRERSWQPATIVKFDMLGRELAACGITYLDEINEASRAKFYNLHASHGLRNSTLSKKINILNWFLRWTNAKGYTAATITKPHLRTLPRTVTFLTWEELIHLYTFDYGSHHSLAHVRDVFCMCAFTGLRYSDAAALRWQDVDSGTLRIVTKKTVEPITIPLNRYASAIVERYRSISSGPRVLLAPSNQVSNRLIKDAAMLAMLDEPVRQVFYRGSERCEDTKLTWEAITTHWARRTFVVHAIRLGIPAEVVIRFTGHSGMDALRPYIAIVDELKNEAMRRFDNG